MCVTPSRIAEHGPVACRNCKRCRHNRVNDWVGRCIAESHTATKSLAVTLTYRGDEPNSAVLVYSDIQKFLKRLRRNGYTVRYIVAGEYGSKKGRAHWHAVLFFYGKTPDIQMDERMDWNYWPHGYSFFQKPNYNGFAYVLKYLLKDQHTQVAETHLAMSKKPPLGTAYFSDWINMHVSEGLAPQSPEYWFRDVKTADGKKHRKFWLQQRMAEIVAEVFIARWTDAHGKPPDWMAEWLTKWEDKWVRQENEMEDIELPERMAVTHFEPERPEVRLAPNVWAYVASDGWLEIRKDNEVWLTKDAEEAAVAVARAGLNRRQRENARLKLRRLVNRFGDKEMYQRWS